MAERGIRDPLPARDVSLLGMVGYSRADHDELCAAGGYRLGLGRRGASLVGGRGPRRIRA